MIAKSDFDYKIRLEELPSIELRDWMYNDVVVTFWESRPKFEKFKEEGAEVESERVVINETTEKPEIEMINHGVSILFFLIHFTIYRSPKSI
jgi:hypothetical protein